MYYLPGINKQPTGCNVEHCWHYVKNFNGKCQCSSAVKGRTGEIGCPGFKERK